LGMSGVSLAGLIAALGLSAAPAIGQVSARSATPAGGTTVTVTAGKPSELAFKLSTYSVPAGKVTFMVTNKGQIGHTFEICTKPSKNSTANTCKGMATKTLNAGKSATLVVTLAKGTYEFLCSIPGHAAAGMKGLLGVGVKVTPPPPPKTTSTAGGTTAATTTTNTAACANPQHTTVSVSEFEYGFTLSPSAIPCGSITFNMTDTGSLEHNFDVQGVPNGAGVGGFLQPGQSSSLTVTLGPGNYTIICDVPEHVTLGMSATMTITG
jgi:uncharacterized cupredoxin-like copper-binding protein